MRAGDLRDRIVIQSSQTTRNEVGEPVLSWTDVCKVWAKIEDMSGREWLAAKQVPANEVTSKVTIRKRDGISPKMRVIFGSRALQIEAVIEPETKAARLELMCSEVT